MFLPLGDAPNPRGVPIVTYLLLGANVAIYALISLPLSSVQPDPSDPLLREYIWMIAERARGPVSLEQILRDLSAYDLFIFRHGFRPGEPSLTDLFFSMFLHANLAHLVGNMLFLWIYGDNVEHRLGPFAYLVAYLGTGAAATLTHTAFDMDSPVPLVGASGAISGVLGFYFIWFPHNQVRLLLFFFPFLLDVITVPARLLLTLYILIDNLLPFLLTRGTAGGVAYGAHIGGFVAGLAVAWMLNRRELVEAPDEYRAARARPVSAAEAIRGALGDGRFEEAAELYFALPPEEGRRLLSPDDSLRLADWLRRKGHARAALAVYRRHIRDYPTGRGAAEANLGAGLIQLDAFDQPTAAYQYFLDALDRDPPPEIAARVRDALDSIARRQKFQVRPRRVG